MTFWKKASDYISPVVHTQLKQRVEDLENRLAEITDGYQAKMRADVDSSKFELDFDLMDVFSIERNYNNQRPFTVIGYYILTPQQYGMQRVVHEWTWYCSMKEHERLVVDFQAWKKARSKK